MLRELPASGNAVRADRLIGGQSDGMTKADARKPTFFRARTVSVV